MHTKRWSVMSRVPVCIPRYAFHKTMGEKNTLEA
jgi:hypothetical protein